MRAFGKSWDGLWASWLKAILVVADGHFVVANSHSNKKEQSDASFAFRPFVGLAISRNNDNGNVRCSERRLFKA
ncbi:MAG: hypothetical protein NOOUEUKL_002505 [Candidatus Fervidibacter sp.]